MIEYEHTYWHDIMNIGERHDWWKRWGFIPSPPDARDYTVSQVSRAIDLPPSIRLDNTMVEVLDQGQCGACLGKALGSILSAGHAQRLSSLYIYTRAKQEDGIPHEEGTYPRVGLKIVSSEGACPDEMLPYSKLSQCLTFPRITPFMKNAAWHFRIQSYARLWGLRDIKRALANNQLVLGGMMVTDSFNDWDGKGIIPPAEPPIYGGHAIVICGYDDNIKALRGLNSWSKGWGDEGFFWISYDFISQNLQGIPAWLESWSVQIIQE